MIALYNPRSSRGRKPIAPLAMLTVAQLADAPSVLVDGNLDRRPYERLAQVLRSQPRPVLALTAMPGPQLHEATDVVRRLRHSVPGLRVLWGGSFASQHPNILLDGGVADVVALGHADQQIPGAIRAMLRGDEVEPGPGLATSRGAGSMPKLPAPTRVDLHTHDLQPWVRPTFLGQRTLGFQTSYGCPFTCGFCSVVSVAEGRWKPLTASEVVEDVHTAHSRWGVDAVEFYDNNFFVDERRVRAYADGVRGLSIRWWGEGRVDRLLAYSDATWRAMADSGLAMVFMGAEAGSDETLARMHKGGQQSASQILALAERMGRLGVVPEFSFVLGAPPEPAADIERTLAFVRRVKQVNPDAEIVLYLYTPEPVKGVLLDAAGDAGFRFPSTLDGWNSEPWLTRVQRRGPLPWVDDALLARVRGFERVLHAYHPTRTDVGLSPRRRTLLRALSSWRYRAQVYGGTWELALAQRLLHYKRPESSGF